MTTKRPARAKRKPAQSVRFRKTWKPREAGCLYECRSKTQGDVSYSEILILGDPQAAAYVGPLHHSSFQAILILPTVRAGRVVRAAADDEKTALIAIGVAGVDKPRKPRYERIIACDVKDRGETRWIVDLLRSRAPHLFLQNRIFTASLPRARGLTYEEFAAALGKARPIPLEPIP